MVGIVEGVDEVFMKRVDVLKAGETVKDCSQFFAEGFLRVFDLSGVESYTDQLLLKISRLKWPSNRRKHKLTCLGYD